MLIVVGAHATPRRLYGQEESESAARHALLAELQRQLEEKEQEAKELETKAEEINQSIEDTQSQKDSLNREIALLNSRINKLSVDIRSTQNQISKTNLSIDTIELQLEEKTFEIGGKMKAIRTTMQQIYETEQDSPFIVFLRNESVSSMFTHIQHLNSLEENLLNGLQELKSLKTALNGEKTRQENLKSSLTRLRTKLTGQQQVEAWQRTQKNSFLAETKNQETEYRKLLVDINQQKEEIAREIFEIEEKIRLTINPDALPEKRHGVLAYPLAQKTVTQGYGPTRQTGFINDAYNFHNGLDFRAAIGTQVFAAGDGEILATGNVSPYAYGQWVAIKHDNNLITLYAHLSVIRAKKGTRVAQGDVIAYSGNTGFSTGPHVHFSVYAADTFQVISRWFGLLPIGGTVNPFDYL